MAERIDSAQVEHIAHLARLALSPNEIERYRDDLSHILSYFDQLNSVHTDTVEPTAHPLPVQNVWREDQLAPSLDSDSALQNAPQHDAPFFLVPRVLDQGSSG